MSAATPASLHPDYRPDIDGLRAVAVLSVVLFHAYPDAIPGGFIGVDIFFVISGYLISTIIFNNLNHNRFSIVDFYKRRVRRIFPALSLVLLATLGLGRLVLYDDEFQNLGAHLGAGTGFVSNLLLWRESGYFDEAAEFKPLLHLWSLGIEEQFYVIWPLVAWVAARRKGSLPWVALAIWLASMALNLYLTPRHGASAFYLPITRFWELLSGGLLAWVDLDAARRLRSPLRRHAAVAGALGLVILVAALAFTNRDRAFPGWWAIPPVLSAVMLIGSGPHTAIAHRLLASRPMVAIGLISYPLYLWHWPLLSYAAIAHGEAPPVWVRTVAVVLALLLAKTTYEWVEKPLREGPLRTHAVPVLSTFMLLIGLFGVGTALHGRSPAQAWRELMGPRPANADNTPVASRRSPDATVMLLGDSHAGHLDTGLRGILGKDLADYTSAGCLPFYDVDRYDRRFTPGTCADKMRAALDLLVASPQLNTVILSTMGPVYLDNSTFRGTDPARLIGQTVVLTTAPEVKDRWQVYETGMRRTLDRLRAAHKRVIFALDVPELGINPRTCLPERSLQALGQSWPIRGGQDCTISKQEFEARAGKFHQFIRHILTDYPEVQLFDPTPLFCNAKQCLGMKSQQLLYRDFDHLSDWGSQYVALAMAPLLHPPASPPHH
jgi:peptidoglycan/LPS O-acetylase OafA/YrhL